MDNASIGEALNLLENGDLIGAILKSSGWSNPESNYTDSGNRCFLFHMTMRNFLFDTAFSMLFSKQKLELIGLFSHPNHFVEGVSKSSAIEFYFLCLDSYRVEHVIRGLDGGQVRLTKAMIAYWDAIETVVAAFESRKLMLPKKILNRFEAIKQNIVKEPERSSTYVFISIPKDVFEETWELQLYVDHLKPYIGVDEDDTVYLDDIEKKFGMAMSYDELITTSGEGVVVIWEAESGQPHDSLWHGAFKDFKDPNECECHLPF